MSLSNEMLELQVAQLRHDEIAHRDILWLPVPQRLTHMTLHYCKYVGRFAEAKKSGDMTIFVSAVLDSFIILLASANATNRRISQLAGVRPDQESLTLARYQAIVANDPMPKNASILDHALVEFALLSGRMAKACESLDHLEKFDSRGAIESALSEATCLLFRLAGRVQLDLADGISSRWSSVERKLIFSPQKVDLDPITMNPESRIFAK